MSNANKINILAIEEMVNMGWTRKAIYNSIPNVPKEELDKTINKVLEKRAILRGQNSIWKDTYLEGR